MYMKYADNGRLGAARRVDIKKKIKALLDRLGSARALIGKQERRQAGDSLVPNFCLACGARQTDGLQRMEFLS